MLTFLANLFTRPSREQLEAQILNLEDQARSTNITLSNYETIIERKQTLVEELVWMNIRLTTALQAVQNHLEDFKVTTLGTPYGREDALNGYSIFAWRAAHEKELVDPLLKLVTATLNPSPITIMANEMVKEQ